MIDTNATEKAAAAVPVGYEDKHGALWCPQHAGCLPDAWPVYAPQARHKPCPACSRIRQAETLLRTGLATTVPVGPSATLPAGNINIVWCGSRQTWTREAVPLQGVTEALVLLTGTKRGVRVYPDRNGTAVLVPVRLNARVNRIE